MKNSKNAPRIPIPSCPLITLFIFTFHFSIVHCTDIDLHIKTNGTFEIGSQLNVSCIANTTKTILRWTRDREDDDNNADKSFISLSSSEGSSPSSSISIFFPNLSFNDFGNYTCHAEGHNITKVFPLLFDEPLKIETSNLDQVTKIGSNTSFSCKITGYPIEDKISVDWYFQHQNLGNDSETIIIHDEPTITQRYSEIKLIHVTQKHNGTYLCKFGHLNSEIKLRVLGPPEVKLDQIKSIDTDKIFVNWTLMDGNDPLKFLELSFFDDAGTLKTINLTTTKTSNILTDLKVDSYYRNFTLIGQNEIGKSRDNWPSEIRTLNQAPMFTPIVYIESSTSNSVSLRWTSSPTFGDFYHTYAVRVKSNTGDVSTYIAYDTTSYMVDKLKPGKDYYFQVKACSNYTNTCESYSSQVNATTMDGVPSAPINLILNCSFNPKTHESIIAASWDIPEHPEGKIVEYLVSLYGNTTYLGSSGRTTPEQVGPINHTVGKTHTEFFNHPPNTRYYVSVCARTRTKICGGVVETSCSLPPSIPNRDELSKANWKAVTNKNNATQLYFMISLPYISQRNGSICCFRIVVVRLPKPELFHELQSPDKLQLISYEEAHNSSNGGAYVAEMVDPDSHINRAIMIGDEDPPRDKPRYSCERCLFGLSNQGPFGQYRQSHHYKPPSALLGVRPLTKIYHKKRHASSNFPLPNIPPAYDGKLDSQSVYTAYLDALVVNNGNEHMWAQSKYFPPLRPTRASEPTESTGSGIESAFLGSLIVAMVVVILAIMCVMRWRRKEPGDEEYGFGHSLQQLCRRLRGQQWVPSENTVEMPAIPADQLVSAFLERHKDGDYGFQEEFDNLPDRFTDRTCHESDKRENSGKNRYPDIKAYDQTRVKLSIIDGVTGSDYINANVVVGYKERKKFICAQGPMESTVIDWWRMVWEQRAYLVLMLTNTEEYNKTKCAKYWPSEGSSVFGDITVTHTSEKRYSDYLVRNLLMKRTRQTENGEVTEEREVLQYHYLVWKDFMAPEHPIGIIRFIKRFNEVYSPDKGPILVHCSAGVGRTGTLVALDSLLEQLDEEKSVTIFNTICDLRHQRNFLVQSLKQYIFIYRALMEMSQFGDTEVSMIEYKSSLEKLKSCSDGKTVSRMEEEFQKLSQVIEDRKAFLVGASEENRHRNRNDTLIPYDRCRVILSPMPGLNNEVCTYINASFIEGYDNTEQFIMAQDPLDVTIGDFWRMIVEQNVRTILMLSEVGEEKCPRYWPEKDQETSHDYIKVKYMQSQSCPFYYKREFTVTNSKTEDSCLVTQFQYNGWPVGSGEVPESTRGLVELVDTILKHQDSIDIHCGPMVVHCSDGGERSCIFVALAILVKQMLTESRVDVFSVVRKLRSQRQGLFQNLAQYDLVYRGLLTYSELHMTNGVDGTK